MSVDPDDLTLDPDPDDDADESETPEVATTE